MAIPLLNMLYHVTFQYFVKRVKYVPVKDSMLAHIQYTVPLWESILAADILVFTLPTYTSDLPMQMESLLNHYYAKFMAHSPEANMFNKQAVVVSHEIGLTMNKNTRAVKDSLNNWGVVRTHTIKQPLFSISWYYVSDKGPLQMQCERIASKVKKAKLA